MKLDAPEMKARKEAEKLEKLYNDNQINMSEYLRRKQDLWLPLVQKDS